MNNKENKSYNYRVYQYIRANGGWANWDLLPIERVEFDFKFELQDRERHYMEALRATLNSLVPNRTQAEYYQDNAEKYKVNANQKHTCDCGGRYTQCNKALHFKTKKHQAYEAFMALTEEQV